ncbi:hypothetical protein F5Y18DRAFT_444552 [Xylariaceae sp. FL1019]|nr:hypothetical protein F5Y18DRAFT_444552 [Xylariaceae sp. FL1019]
MLTNIIFAGLLPAAMAKLIFPRTENMTLRNITALGNIIANATNATNNTDRPITSWTKNIALPTDIPLDIPVIKRAKPSDSTDDDEDDEDDEDDDEDADACGCGEACSTKIGLTDTMTCVEVCLQACPTDDGDDEDDEDDNDNDDAEDDDNEDEDDENDDRNKRQLNDDHLSVISDTILPIPSVDPTSIPASLSSVSVSVPAVPISTFPVASPPPFISSTLSRVPIETPAISISFPIGTNSSRLPSFTVPGPPFTSSSILPDPTTFPSEPPIPVPGSGSQSTSQCVQKCSMNCQYANIGFAVSHCHSNCQEACASVTTGTGIGSNLPIKNVVGPAYGEGCTCGTFPEDESAEAPVGASESDPAVDVAPADDDSPGDLAQKYATSTFSLMPRDPLNERATGDAPAVGTGDFSYEICMQSCTSEFQHVSPVFDIHQDSTDCEVQCAAASADGAGVLGKKDEIPAVGTGMIMCDACMTVCSSPYQGAGIGFDVSAGETNCESSCFSFSADGTGILNERQVTSKLPASATPKLPVPIPTNSLPSLPSLSPHKVPVSVPPFAVGTLLPLLTITPSAPTTIPCGCVAKCANSRNLVEILLYLETCLTACTDFLSVRFTPYVSTPPVPAPTLPITLIA